VTHHLEVSFSRIRRMQKPEPAGSPVVGRDRCRSDRPAALRTGWLAMLWLAQLASIGCTSPLTGLALKEFLRESTASVRADYDSESDDAIDADGVDGEPVAGARAKAEPAADEVVIEPSEGPSDGVHEGRASAVIEAAGGAAAAAGRQLEQAISRSLERFARARGADATAQALLVETLEKSPRGDWPEIIDSFSLSLENAAADAPKAVAGRLPSAGGLTVPVDRVAAAGPAAAVAAAAQDPADEPDPTGDAESPSADGLEASADAPPAAADGPQAPGTGDGAVPQAEPAAPGQSPAPEDIVASLRQALAEARRRAPLTIVNPCFASRVRGWAAVDRFPQARFTPGQQVIVYLELENLVPAEDSSGATTRIDTSFRLLDADGTLVDEWSFPTVEDRSASPRTDFFARYFWTVPETAAAGPHGLEVVVSDRVAGKDAASRLELEIQP